MKFSLLKEEDIYGENRLSIFKKISPVAMATDLVRNEREEMAYSYWLDSYTVRNVNIISIFGNSSIPVTRARCVGTTGYTYLDELDRFYIGVRLKISIDDVKNEIIKDILKDTFYVISEENGVKVVLALEWPQDFATGEDKQNIELLEHHGKLKNAQKCFNVSPNTERQAIYYKQNMYVKFNKNWAKVSPIQWYYAEEEQILVSKKVLFWCPMLEDSGYYIEDFNYEKSTITRFLQEKFLKQAIMDSEEKALYHFLIAPFYEDYKDELKEINFWKSFLEKRKERKANLEKIKKCSGTELEELPKIIDEILELNEEDEKLLKEHVIPYYCQK